MYTKNNTPLIYIIYYSLQEGCIYIAKVHTKILKAIRSMGYIRMQVCIRIYGINRIYEDSKKKVSVIIFLVDMQL